MLKYPTKTELTNAVKNAVLNSGGKNSTAKTVSITYGMTTEEIRKRMQYNLEVSKGVVKVPYEQYSKTVKTTPVKSPTTYTSLPKLVLPTATKSETKQPKLVVPLTAPSNDKTPASGKTPVSGNTTVTAPKLHNPVEFTKALDARGILNLGYLPESAKDFYNNFGKPLLDAMKKADELKPGAPYSPAYRDKVLNALKVAEEDHAYALNAHSAETIDTLDLSSNELIVHEPLSETNLHEFERAQKANTMHMVFLTDDKDVCTTRRIGTSEISRQYVDNSEGIDVLYYDAVTKKFYSVTVERKETKEIADNKKYWADEITKTINGLESDVYSDITTASNLASKLNTYKTKINNHTMTSADWTEYNKLAKQYTQLVESDSYIETATKYNETYNYLLECQKKYDEAAVQYESAYGKGIIVATEDWYNKVLEEVDKVNEVRKTYHEEVEKNKYFNGYDDTNEINSFGDGFKSMIGKWGSGVWWKEQWEEYKGYSWARPLYTVFDGLVEPVLSDFAWEGFLKSVVWETFIQPSYGVVVGDLTAGEGFKAFGNNLLVNLGETADALNFLKPLVVANWSYNNPEARAQSKVLQTAYDNSENGWQYIGNVFNYWTNTYGATPYEGPANVEAIWLAGEDPNIFDYIAYTILDIALDPSTWMSFGVSKFATTSAKGTALSSVDEVTDFVRAVETANGFATELTEDQIMHSIIKAGKKAIKTGADYSDMVVNQLAKSYAVAGDLTVKQVFKNLPDNALGAFIRNATDGLEFRVRRTLYPLLHPVDSGATKHMLKSFSTELKLNNMLTDAYRIIDKATDIYKAMDTIDNLMFSFVLPAEPVAMVARSLKNVIKTGYDSVRTAILLKRITSKTAQLIDETGDIPLNRLDEYMDIVEEELRVFSKGKYEDISNEFHRALRTHSVNAQLKALLDTVDNADLSKRGTAAELLEKLTKQFSKMGTEELPITDLTTYLYYLKKPLGSSQHSVYDMLDSTLVSKLRTLQTEYNRLVRIRALDELYTLSDGVSNWSNFIRKRITDIVDAPKVVDIVDVQLADDFNKVIKIFDDTKKLFIEQLTTVSKADIQDAILSAQKEMSKIFDAALTGEEFSRVALDARIDDVQNLLNKYINDVRDVYARRYFQSMDSKVERVLVPLSEKPDKDAFYHEFLTGFSQALNKQYGVDVTEAMLADKVFKKLSVSKNTDKVDFNEYLRMYLLMPEKSSRALAYMSDAYIEQHLQPFLDNQSTVLGVIDVMQRSPALLEPTGNLNKLYNSLVSFQKEAVTLSITTAFNEYINKLDIADSLKVGILDALAGEQKVINKIWADTVKIDSASKTQAVERITHHLIDKAATFLSQKDSSHATKLFSPVLEQGGKRISFCSINPALNVDNMVDNLELIPHASEYLAENADEYYDIYFSLSKTGDNTTPYAIAFKHGDETVVFRNSDTRFRAENDYLLNTHGITYDEAYADFIALGTDNGVPRAEFDEAISNQLLIYKALAEKENKRIRFIGYNNGLMGTRQDNALRKYIQKNAIPVHNDLTVDLADFLRVERGLPVFSTSACALVKDGVQRCVNMSSSQGCTKLLTVFDHTLFAEAKKLAADLSASKEVLAHVVSEPYMDSTINAILNLGDAVKAVKKGFGEATEAINDVSLDEKVLVDIINELNPSARITGINVHAILEEAMAYTGENFSLNAYKLLDSAKYKYLFNLDDLSKIVRVNELQSLKEVSRDLLTMIGNIRQPEVLEELGVETYRKLFSHMLKESKIKNFYKRVNLRVLTHALDNKTADANVMFSVCRYLLTHARIDGMELVNTLKKTGDDTLLEALYTVKFADEIVFNKGGGTFTHDHKLFMTNLYGKSTDHAKMLIDMREFDECVHMADDLIEYATKRTATQYSHNVISAGEQICSEIFRTVAEPYDNIIRKLDIVAYPPSAFDTRLDYLRHVRAVSNKVADRKRCISYAGDIHREAALRTVFSLSDEDFFVYLVRECKNTLVLDINCSYMQSQKTRTLVFNKLEELKRLKNTFVVDDSSKDGIIKIYHDVTNLGQTDMDKFYLNLLDKKIDYATLYREHRAQIGYALVKNVKENSEHSEAFYKKFREFIEDYVRLEDTMSKQMPDHWLVSTFTTNTQTTAEYLQEQFPEAARMNLADMGVYGMFDEAFTCSVWADSSVIRSKNLVQYYSDDVMKSIGNGLYQVRNNLEAVNNKFALYANERMSLKWLVENSGIQFSDYHSLNQQLDEIGWVLHKGWTDDKGNMHVRMVTVHSNKELADVLSDSTVFVSPVDVYSDLVQFAKGNNKDIKLDRMLGNSRNVYEVLSYALAQQRIMFSAGALFTRTGSWFKNDVDGMYRAILSTNDASGVIAQRIRARELSKRYEEVCAKISNKYSRCGASEIAQYFKEYPDDVCGLSLDTMRTIYAYKSSPASGTMAGTIISLQNEAVYNKLLGLCEDTPEITEDMLNKVIQTYHKEARRAQVHPNKDFIKHKASVREALIKQGFEGKLLDKFTDLYYSYTASTTAMSDFLYNSPSLLARMQITPAPDIHTVSKLTTRKSMASNALTFNLNRFSAIEDEIRLGLVMYYTDDLNYMVSRASSEIRKTQFDYSSRPALLDKLEGLFPFITFSLYNTKYWLFDAPKHHGVLRTATKIAMASEPYYDEEELLNIKRGILLRRKLASGDIAQKEDGTVDYEDSPSSVWAAFAHTILGTDGVVEEYQGQLRQYAQLTGALPLGDHHVIKLGNSFLDAVDFSEMIAMAIPQVLAGEVPDILKEKVYTPIRVMLGAFAHYTTNGFDQESLNKWIEDNWFDVLSFLPYYGTLVNNAITHLKNGRLNMQDLWVIVSNPQLKDEFLYTFCERFLCVLGTAVPSIVGTVYDNNDYYSRPIGYDWYNQSEEYRKTHRYVWGVSYIPTWTQKNPGVYTDYLGKYIELGYDKEQALEILNVLFGNYDKAPINWAFNQELFDSTLAYLLEQDYEMSEALELLKNEELWNTSALAKYLGAITKQQAVENSVYYKMYDMLPDYIKYTDGQYAALRKHYKSLGYTEEQTWAAMWTGKGFINPAGNYVDLTPEKVHNMNQELNDNYAEFMLGLPSWYKYEPGAASRTVKYLKDTKGMNTEQARRYIISNNFYVTSEGKPTFFTEEESKQRTKENEKEFREYYDTLPDFIKYEAGAYSRTLKHLLAIGYDEASAKQLIKEGMYLTLDGTLIDSTELVRNKQYNTLLSNNYRKVYRSYSPRPKRVKKRYNARLRVRKPYKVKRNGSTNLTYSLTNARNGANFGTRNAYKVTLGYNSASSILSTKGNYPQVWRNIAQSYRRNLYKEHYAKYGMSRIQMRSGGWKGYSNASVTKLRRENVYSARRYRNRRVF